MRIVPKNQVPRIQFFELRVGRWAEHAEALGVPPDLIAEVAAHTAAARDALKAKHAADNAARSATLRLKDAIAKMSTKGAAAIGFIGAKGMQPGGEGVYSLAFIPKPKKHSKIGPPGTPTRFTHELQQCGWLTLRWMCTHPRGTVGTIYQLRRSIAGGPFQRIGLAGQRKFVDKTIPAGATSILYEIQAQRSKTKGSVATYSVNLFGTTRAGDARTSMAVQLAA